MAKLYEVPTGAKIKIAEDGCQDDNVYKFWHPDGMYSYCTDKDGKVVYFVMWTEVEVIE